MSHSTIAARRKSFSSVYSLDSRLSSSTDRTCRRFVSRYSQLTSWTVGIPLLYIHSPIFDWHLIDPVAVRVRSSLPCHDARDRGVPRDNRYKRILIRATGSRYDTQLHAAVATAYSDAAQSETQSKMIGFRVVSMADLVYLYLRRPTYRSAYKYNAREQLL